MRPDPDFYVRYVDLCHRLGVEPSPADRVRELVGEWSRMLTGGCYTCRYFGRRVAEVHLWCERPRREHVRSQPDRGCAFWQRELGADE